MNGTARQNSLGSLPWPVGWGGFDNTCMASAIIRPAGKTLWSLPISASVIVVAEDGCLFVAAEGALTAIEPDGWVRWRHDTPDATGLMVLPGGLLIHTEQSCHRLVAREQSTGKELWALQFDYWSPFSPAATPDGAILKERYFQAGGAPELCCIQPDGVLSWSYRLSRVMYTQILALKDIIITNDGSYLAGLTHQGELRWIANRHGFIPGDAAAKVERVIEHENFTASPKHLAGSRILAGCRWYDGSRLLVLDIGAQTVTIMDGQANEPAIPFRDPIAVTRNPALRFAGSFFADLRVFDLSGKLVFNRTAPSEIRNIITDPAGSFVALFSVDRDYWEKYRVPYELDDACGLLAIDAAGNELFKWFAPGPMVSALAVGKSGELYCVSEGQLWAVG